MACYTLSNCVLENLEENRYTTDLLFVFIQENEHQIAFDKSGIIIEIYSTTIQNIPDFNIKIGAIYWLSSIKEKKWGVNIDNTDDDIFMAVCGKTADKRMIVSSVNECQWAGRISPSPERMYSHKNDSIKILNKDEAILELKPKTTTFQQNNTNTNTNTNK